MADKRITRIEMAKVGNRVQVRRWFDGWKEGAAPDEKETLPKAWIVTLLMEYEKQGFACSMPDATHGIALCSAPVRIDFFQQPDGDWRVMKYPEGWKPGQNPMENKIVKASAAQDGIQWCEGHGWNVRRWPGGARAFRGAVRPVRDRASIMYMRENIYTVSRLGERVPVENRHTYDFAIDY